jgi:hypothetical protein
MDIGFERAGFEHVASFEIMEHAVAVLREARPKWRVFGGVDGDVCQVDWRGYRGEVDVLHGGPPCSPSAMRVIVPVPEIFATCFPNWCVPLWRLNPEHLLRKT